MEVNILDLVFGGLIIYGSFKGFRKGVIVELASLLALVLGIYGAIHFSGYVADQLANYIDWDKRYVDLAAFGLTSIGIVFGVSLLEISSFFLVVDHLLERLHFLCVIVEFVFQLLLPLLLFDF